MWRSQRHARWATANWNGRLPAICGRWATALPTRLEIASTAWTQRTGATPRRSLSSSSFTLSPCTPAVVSSEEPPLPPSRPPPQLLPNSLTWTATSSSLIGEPGRIMVYASEVAGIVGLNPFRPMCESFERIWSRTEPEAYKRMIAVAESELGRRLLSRDETAQMILSTPSGAVSAAHLSVVLARVQELSFDELEREKETLRSLAGDVADIDETERKYLIDYLIGQVSKSYGVVNEDRAIRAYELVSGISVVDNNRLFYARQIDECIIDGAGEAVEMEATLASEPPSSVDAITSSSSPPLLLRRGVWLGGRVDGFSSASGHLIEMKNRTRKFLDPLPLYDRCQFECYLQVCEVAEGELVERLRKKVDETEAQSERRRIGAGTNQTTHPTPASQFARRSDREETEDEDTTFLHSSGASAPTTTATLPPISSARDIKPTSVAAFDIVDTAFLSDLTPLAAAPEDEEDASFLITTTPAAVANINKASSQAARVPPSPLSATAIPTSPPASNPVLSVPSIGATRFEIFGTQQLSDEQTVTHILIEESLSLVTADTTAIESTGLVDPDLLAGFLAAAQPEIIDPLADSETRDAADEFSPSSSSLYIDRLKRTVVRRDESQWSGRILPGIRRFAAFLTRFLADPNAQLRYLKCVSEDEKHALLAEIIPPPPPTRPFDRVAYAKMKRRERQIERERAMRG